MKPAPAREAEPQPRRAAFNRRHVVAGAVGACVVALAALLGWPTLEGFAAAWMGMAGCIDAAERRVPNALSAFGLVALLLLHAALGFAALPSHLLAMAAAAAAVLAVRGLGQAWRGTPGMGIGDVKAAMVLGLGVGLVPALQALWGAAVLAGVFGLAGLLQGRLSRSSRLAFVPFLFASLVAVLLLAHRAS